MHKASIAAGDAREVRRLARRKEDGKRAGKVAQKVLDWGVPVLESSITLVADGRLLYRRRDAMELRAPNRSKILRRCCGVQRGACRRCAARPASAPLNGPRG